MSVPGPTPGWVFDYQKHKYVSTGISKVRSKHTESLNQGVGSPNSTRDTDFRVLRPISVGEVAMSVGVDTWVRGSILSHDLWRST